MCRVGACVERCEVWNVTCGRSGMAELGMNTKSDGRQGSELGMVGG